MTRFSTLLTVCTALTAFAPAAAIAQSDTTIETQPAENAPRSIEDQLPLGVDADTPLETAEPTVGQAYTAETIGAWQLRCVKVAEGEEPCQMYQLMDDGEGSPVAEVSLFRLPAGGQAVAGATIVVPLETSLPNQFTIAIDGGTARRYPYAFCNAVGCYVRLGLTDDDINAFKRGNEAKMTIVPALAPDQQVVLTMSLEGFTASYDKVTEIER